MVNDNSEAKVHTRILGAKVDIINETRKLFAKKTYNLGMISIL